jgi:hypothetical protein
LFFFHLALTGSSTSSLRHHIRTKHPRDWAKVVEAEKSKAEQDAANKAEAKKLQEEMEGDPDEDEEDLTPSTPQPTPGIYFQFSSFSSLIEYNVVIYVSYAKTDYNVGISSQTFKFDYFRNYFRTFEFRISFRICFAKFSRTRKSRLISGL